MAVVSEQFNFIFVHIFKCGGNSVRKALGAPSVGSDVDTLHATELMGAHVGINDVQKHYRRTKNTKFFDNAFKFAFVRNPFDWLLSTYFYIKCSSAHRFHECVKNMKLIDFLNWYVFAARYIERPFGSNKYLHLKNFISDEYCIPILDFVGRLETMETDMQTVYKKIGMQPKTIQVVNKNTNKERDWKPYYDKESKEFVELYFGEDLKYFGYNFEGFVK